MKPVPILQYLDHFGRVGQAEAPPIAQAPRRSGRRLQASHAARRAERSAAFELSAPLSRGGARERPAA